jgi:hypothetical protein
MPMYRPSTSPYQFPKSGQSWAQSPQSRIIGGAAVSTGTSASAGSAGRVYNYLRRTKGNDFAVNYFKLATFGPYQINKAGTGLILG